jgi:cell division protein FtsA
MNLLGSGIVITGGTSCLDGIIELAEDVFELPVRRGIPGSVTGLVDVVRNPVYATGVGLSMHSSKDHRFARPRFRMREGSVFRKMRDRMVSWFREFF